MKKVIWKYPLRGFPVENISMPKGAEILCVQMQHNIPCLWALVDPSADETSRVIETYGTGHPFTPANEIKYIGTYQQGGGVLVWHVFETLYPF